MSNSPPSLPHPLQDLIARVEAATGADRNLSFDIIKAVGVPTYGLDAVSYYGWVKDHPTASIDAALGLVERVLPDPQWVLSQEPTDFAASLITHGATPPMVFERGKTPALALLLALLRAVAAEAHEPAQLTRDA